MGLKKIQTQNALTRFIENESTGGIIMIGFAILAIFVANSQMAAWYQNFISIDITLSFGSLVISEELKNAVKDILMVLFFLLIGLELKKEICEGFLSSRDQILLPLLCAIGGMAVPALIFLALNYHKSDISHGWAISSATDIAFALALLSLIGKKVAPSVKIFLLAVAIFDDLGAIIIIALFYNTGLHIEPLLLTLCGISALIILNRLLICNILPYILIGIYLWFCLYNAGIHTTLAGVLVGLAVPMRNPYKDNESPLKKFMHFLHPIVSFIVLPIFAFTAAGVSLKNIDMASISNSLTLGIVLGLFFGKQIGIFLTSWLLIKLKIVSMPEGGNLKQLYLVSILAGIGFTMSLFIGMLAFSDPALQDLVKIGVILGSLLAICWGIIFSLFANR